MTIYVSVGNRDDLSRIWGELGTPKNLIKKTDGIQVASKEKTFSLSQRIYRLFKAIKVWFTSSSEQYQDPILLQKQHNRFRFASSESTAYIIKTENIALTEFATLSINSPGVPEIIKGWKLPSDEEEECLRSIYHNEHLLDLIKDAKISEDISQIEKHLQGGEWCWGDRKALRCALLNHGKNQIRGLRLAITHGNIIISKDAVTCKPITITTSNRQEQIVAIGRIANMMFFTVNDAYK